MCDCRKRIEEQLLARFKEVSPEATDHEVYLLGYAFILGEKLTEKGCMEIKQVAKFPLKKGGMKERKVQLSMTFTYCPFCGVKYE